MTHTRANYINDRTCTHAEYYRQFVTPRVLRLVEKRIGLDKLKRSTDEHLNDIPLAEWDGLGFEIAGDFGSMARKAGDFDTMAGRVCFEASSPDAVGTRKGHTLNPLPLRAPATFSPDCLRGLGAGRGWGLTFETIGRPMTTTQEITPGPWHVEKANGRYEIWPKDKGQTHTYIGTIQTKADAQFVASAPALLKALELSINWLSSYPGGGAAKCYDSARAAIAQAKGETP